MTATKEHILDAAEDLIAERGIDAVSLRAITRRAKVNLAAVHYHFGSKDALVAKVFERRVVPMNKRRLALLDELERTSGDGALPLEGVLRSLMEPPIRLYQEHGRGRIFMRMCARIYAEPAPYLEKVFDELFRDLVARFIAAFQRALPEVPEAERAWRIHFSVGTLIHTMMESERLKRFSGGLCDPSDTEAVIDQIVRFCAAGMRAPAPAAAPPNHLSEQNVSVLMEAM